MKRNKEKPIEMNIEDGVIDSVNKYEIGPEQYAAIYARKSTLLDNNSIESQIEVAKRKLTDLGLYLFNTYSDEESATKYNPIHRPGFKQLLLDAHKEKFKTLLVFRRDRLARRVEDLIEIKNIFKKLGIKIIYSNEGEFQSDNSYISSFIENIIISVDELEPSILRERIITGINEQRSNGNCYFRAPFGLVKKNDKYKPDGQKADVIKAIFSLFESMEFYTRDEAFEKILTSIHYNFPHELVGKLTKKRIKEYLTNPRFAGYITADSKLSIMDCFNENGEIDDTKIIECTCVTPLITPLDRWFSILKKYRNLGIDRKSYIDDEPHIFKNVLFCKKCKKPLHLINKRFICSCGSTNLPKSEIEPILLRRIFMDTVTEKNIIDFYDKYYNDYNKEIDDIQNNIDKANQEIREGLSSILSAYPNFEKEIYDKLTDNLLDEVNEKNKLESEKNLLTLIDNAVQYLLTKNEIENIMESDNFNTIINRLVQNTDYAQITIQGLINKIQVIGISKEDIYDERNRSIEYKFKIKHRTSNSLFESIY